MEISCYRLTKMAVKIERVVTAVRGDLSAPNYLSSIGQGLGLTDSTLECGHIALLICYIRPVKFSFDNTLKFFLRI